MKMKSVFVDQVNRFGLTIDEESGRKFVSIPVSNRMTDYEEWYEIDYFTFQRFVEDPTRAHDFVAQAKRRELDHLLLFPPGSDRGWA
jgi:hypothetical protein